MPRGSKGEKRPADVIGNAVHVMRIATGEIEDTAPDDGIGLCTAGYNGIRIRTLARPIGRPAHMAPGRLPA